MHLSNVLNNTSNKTMKEITILNAAGGLLGRRDL